MSLAIKITRVLLTTWCDRLPAVQAMFCCWCRELEITQCVLTCLVNDVIYLVLLWCLSSQQVLLSLTMKAVALLTVFLFLRCEGATVVVSSDAVNDRPFIGVLAQEQSFYLNGKYPEENYTSYIAASYVKDVESAGARVVPIMIGKDRAYYEEIMSKINGVIFPGGATYFNQSNGYADAGQHIYDIARELNDAGDYFPIFGTCLGFQLIIVLASGRHPENRITCSATGINMPLEFKDDYRTSKMYGKAPADIVDILATQDVTVNEHQFCVTEDNLKSHNLTDDWRALTLNDDVFGVTFISSYEHNRYPFYAVQFHPEKIAFEWKLSKNYNHSQQSLKANRYYMDFFVSEARKSRHTFASAAEENQYVIWNYEAKFTGVLGSAHHQCYFFEPRGTSS